MSSYALKNHKLAVVKFLECTHLQIKSMATIKTVATEIPIERLIARLSEKKQNETKVLLAIFQKCFDCTPVLWGESIVGYGTYEYTNSTKKLNKFFVSGFSIRGIGKKEYFSLYIMTGLKRYPELLKKLGKHRHSVSCLYVNNLVDIELDILQQLIKLDIQEMKKRYVCTLD